MDTVKTESFLRISAALLLVLTACLVGFDSQTKLLFYSIVRKATFRDMNALIVLVWVDSVAAGYNLLHLLLRSSLCSSRFKGKNIPMVPHPYMAWFCFFLDQATVYVVFAANSAAMEASFLAVTGSSIFQWMKVCNRFTRFCVQIGGAFLSGIVASVLLIAISFLSAFSLFRLYSPSQFLLLKSR
ncbi:CASP-like protein 2C1 [Rhododendron vialii]|uniref:CASP-like protein 2C1 n=1 Tax=Rhododendron vialii TaxID=182163 RepID=UPI00265EF7D1|nr:CASP-like protein 2C1 [Rhododendron vialii]